MKELKDLPLDLLDPAPTAIRQDYDQERLNELAASIMQIGLIEPLIVKPSNGRYEIIAGHRRYYALRLARKEEAACLIEDKNRDEATAAALHENLFRHDPSDIEYAHHFADLVAHHNYTPDQIATALGKSRGFVTTRLEILTYGATLIEALAKKELSLSVCKELAAIDNPGEQERLIHFARVNGITARTAAQWRQAYEATRQPLTQDTIDSPAPTNHPAPPIPQYPCFGCDTPVIHFDLTILRVCKNCLQTLLAAKTQTPD